MNQQNLAQRPHSNPNHLLPARANTQLINTYRGRTIAVNNPDHARNEYHTNYDHKYTQIPQSSERILFNKLYSLEGCNKGIESALRSLHHRHNEVYDKVAPLEKRYELQCSTVNTILHKLTYLEDVLPHKEQIKQILDLQTAVLDLTNRCFQNDTHLFHKLTNQATHVAKLLSDVQLVLYKQSCLGTAVDNATTELNALAKNSHIASANDTGKDVAALTNAVALLNGNLLASNRQTSELAARIGALERKEVKGSKEIREDLNSLIADFRIWRSENDFAKVLASTSNHIHESRHESDIAFENALTKKFQKRYASEMASKQSMMRLIEEPTKQKFQETDLDFEKRWAENYSNPAQQKPRVLNALRAASEMICGNTVHDIEEFDLYELSTRTTSDATSIVSFSSEDDAEELLSGSFVDVMEMFPTKEEILSVENGGEQLQDNDYVNTSGSTPLHSARFILRKVVAMAFTTILSLAFFRLLFATYNFAILAKVAMFSITLACIHFFFLADFFLADNRKCCPSATE